jgi:hypothetical protein
MDANTVIFVALEGYAVLSVTLLLWLVLRLTAVPADAG